MTNLWNIWKTCKNNVFCIKSLWNIWNNNSKEDTIRLKALNILGDFLMKSFPDSALKIIEDELSFAKQINHRKSIGNAFLNIGAYYRQRGMYMEAISIFQRSNDST